jgi:ABC-type transport system involved in multi-copper enzyme maturation permease subunit
MLYGERLGREVGMAINAGQVAIGLLMLSISAATSLAEERQRGGLDVLMSTPLPTRSIVWGKWWGVFRLTPRLLILPLLLTFAFACHTGQYWGVALMAALILSYGAAITSMGLALATWIPGLGRAVGVTVGLYTMMCLGWIPLSFVFFGDGPADDGVGVSAGSPLMGVGIYSMLLSGIAPAHEAIGQVAWMGFWTAAYSGVALALLLATLGTFNNCLGRIDQPSLFDDDQLGMRRRQRRPASVD